MRSIGKRNIKKLYAIVDEVYNAHTGANFTVIAELVMESVPTEWHMIWESAWSEMNRLIIDRLWTKG